MAIEIQITIDCADPAALSRFWAEALGYQLQPPPGNFETWDEALDALGVPVDQRNDASAIVDQEGGGPRMFFQRVPEAKRTKNRVHLDLRVAPGLEGNDRMEALEADAARLLALGATRIERHDPVPPLSNGHIIMADPEGNEFCVD